MTKINKYLLERLQSASHVTNQLMLVSTEYSEEIQEFDINYEISEEWALLFSGQTVILEQYAVIDKDMDDKEFIQKDITEEWNQHGGILHVLEYHIGHKNTFIGDDGKVAL